MKSREKSKTKQRRSAAVAPSLVQGASGGLWAVRLRACRAGIDCHVAFANGLLFAHAWQAVARHVSEAVSVRLGPVFGPSQAQLDDFKSRALRAETPSQRHLYATEWLVTGDAKTRRETFLAMSDQNRCAFGTHRAWHGAAVATHATPVVDTVATASGQITSLALPALETVLTLVQLQSSTLCPPSVLFFTTAAAVPRWCAHAGSWGLGRAARAEASLPLHHVCASGPSLVSYSLPSTEPEAALVEQSIVAHRGS